MVGEGFEGVRSNSDSLRKAVKRALDALISELRVRQPDGGTIPREAQAIRAACR